MSSLKKKKKTHFLKLLLGVLKADMRYCVKTPNRLMVHLASVINNYAGVKETFKSLNCCFFFFLFSSHDISYLRNDQNN